ncbi:hypothetical protein BKA62DRAFT_687955 [Auriculariales sp. MPI-PUGE-AT-0066]|nr:hypothetical protein BKA62DRAFT_687955 [Auriculariales sp. MPI-PUGE-AT-0066]
MMCIGTSEPYFSFSLLNTSIMAASGRSALVVGATGQVGRYLLTQVLASPAFTSVAEYGRRVTSSNDIPKEHASKLVQKTVDFEKLNEAEWKDPKFDAVFIALGTTRADAGSAQAFEKIDREYVLNAAKAARVEGIEQRLVYCSVSGASASSPFLYVKSKGLTENGLAALGYKDTISVRPCALGGARREKPRMLEDAFVTICYQLNRISPRYAVDISEVARAMRKAGELGIAGLPPSAETFQSGPAEMPCTIIPNQGILALAKET